MVTALTKVLGTADASADLERRLRQPIPKVGVRSDRIEHTPTQPVSSLLEQAPSRSQTQGRTGRDGPAQRRPRPGARAASRESGQTTVIRPAPRGPRRWIGILLILAVLLIAAGIVSALVLDQRLAGAPAPVASKQPSAPASTAPSAKPVKLVVVGARDFDPQADPPKRIRARSRSPTTATPRPAGPP